MPGAELMTAETAVTRPRERPRTEGLQIEVVVHTDGMHVVRTNELGGKRAVVSP